MSIYKHLIAAKLACVNLFSLSNFQWKQVFIVLQNIFGLDIGFRINWCFEANLQNAESFPTTLWELVMKNVLSNSCIDESVK